MAKSCNIILAHELGKIVCETLGIDPLTVSRIIIDIDAGSEEPLQIYVKMFGNRDTLEIDWSVLRDGAHIRILSEEA